MAAVRAGLALVMLCVACGAGPDVRARRPADPPAPAEPTTAAPPPTAPPAETGRLQTAHTIPDELTWRRLAARPASASVARTEVVKFLVDTAHGRTLWFVDTERWPIHYFFARDRLSTPEHPIGATPEAHELFNATQYRRPDRRFEMGSIVHYLDADLWTMELVSGDNLSGERVLALFEQVRAALWIGDRLRYRPLSEIHEIAIAPVRGRLPLTSADEVFAGVRYQPLTQGTAFGTLRFVRGPFDPSTARPDEILVLERLPDEIPVVAGVISNELQAPLGHIAILCATRGTPNMGLRGALGHPELARLEGRLVALTVGRQEFSIREASRDEAERAWASRRPPAARTPRLDRGERRLLPLCGLRIADADVAGAKASQLGEACSLGPPVRTPGGFVVPFAHYLEHLERAGIGHAIGPMLADPAFGADAAVRAERLAALRAAIESAPVEPGLLQQMRRAMQREAPRARWILRSSTNAEDLEGFTGAGLYRSVVVSAGASEQELADAIRRVWASVWLQGAFEEREWYRIDHGAVAMAVLAQPFVDGASANGVAITQNPFYEGRPGFFVNAQALGGSVTGAAGDEIPEQHIIYTYSDVIENEVLSRSSRTGGQPLLGEREILELAEVLAVLHRHFTARWSAGANACDVEFLIAQGRVLIVQVRPYTVAWGSYE